MDRVNFLRWAKAPNFSGMWILGPAPREIRVYTPDHSDRSFNRCKMLIVMGIAQWHLLQYNDRWTIPEFAWNMNTVIWEKQRSITPIRRRHNFPILKPHTPDLHESVDVAKRVQRDQRSTDR
jgi:hypothetical protein